MKLALVLLTISFSLFAQRLTLSVQSPQAIMGEQIQIQLKVEGQMSSSMPKLEGVSDFTVQNGGSSSQMNIINGTVTRSKVFNLYLFPKRTGSFVIGPAKAEIGGQVIESNRAKIIVHKETAKKKSQRLYFLEAGVSNKSPYVGEQVTYSFKVYYRQVRFSNWGPDLPDFSSDFWVETIADIRRPRQYEKIIDGIRWGVIEASFALFPNRAGKVIIPGAASQIQITMPSRRQNNSLFGSFLSLGGESKLVNLRSQDIEMNVKPLPLPKPVGFSGLVGDFRLSTMLTKYTLPVGDSTTLTVKVVGEGNIRGLAMPKVGAKGFKTYQDKPQTTVEADEDRMIGLKEWNLALVPQKEGEFDLGPIEISYFDPKSGEYKKSGPKSIKFSVIPGSEEKKVTTSPIGGDLKQRVSVVGEDLRPLKRDVFSFSSDEITIVDYFLGLFSILLMPLLFFIINGFFKRSLRFKNDSNLLRRDRAYKVFSSNLGNLKDDDSIYEVSSKALRSFIGDKTGSDGMALTPVDAEKLLGTHGVSLDLTQNVVSFLKTCEMGIYGGHRTSFEEMRGNLVHLGKSLDKELNK